MKRDEARATLFRAQSARAWWLYRESLADGKANGWHLLRIVSLARDFGQPVPDAVRDALADATDNMLTGTDPAEALGLRDTRGGSPRVSAKAGEQRARIVRWLSIYLPERAGGAPGDRAERFATAGEAYAEAARIFGVSARHVRGLWAEYRGSRAAD